MECSVCLYTLEEVSPPSTLRDVPQDKILLFCPRCLLFEKNSLHDLIDKLEKCHVTESVKEQKQHA